MPNSKKSDYFSPDQKELAIVSAALGHPIRIAILQLLQNNTCCYHGDMAEELPIAKSTLSQHLKALKEVGLIQGNIESPNIKYCVNKQKLEHFKTLLTKSFI